MVINGVCDRRIHRYKQDRNIRLRTVRKGRWKMTQAFKNGGWRERGRETEIVNEGKETVKEEYTNCGHPSRVTRSKLGH